MPFTTPPTFADAAILTATQLNILSDDLEYLNGIVGGAINVPFTSHRRIDNFDSTNNQYLIQHQNRYLHFKVRLLANDNNDLDIFYNSVRIYHDGTLRSATYSYTGYVDLNNPELWSDWIGAWSSIVTYGQHDIVSSAGVYYASKQNGNLNNLVSDTAWWNNLGAAAAFAAAGTYYYLYIDTNLTASPQIVLDYLLESSETTL